MRSKWWEKESGRGPNGGTALEEVVQVAGTALEEVLVVREEEEGAWSEWKF
jgi:hypothetical protein